MKPQWTLALLGLLAGCGEEAAKTTQKADPAPLVTAASVVLRPIDRELSLSGVLVAREEAAVGAELTGYRVLRVLVEEGDVVRQGQALAVLDPALLDQEVAQARTAAERAASEYRRVADLTGSGVVAEETIEQRGFEAQSTAAKLRDLQERRARLTLRAPVAGRVLARTIKPGDVSGAADSGFRLARGGLMELDAQIPEAELGRVRVGTAMEVRLASGEVLTGSVRLVSPAVDPDTKLGRVRILLPAHPALRVGGFATARIDAAGAPVPTVPERAVQYRAGGPTVTVIGAGDRVWRVAIRTGETGGGFVELVQGPPVGARVVMGGAAFVLPGDKVRVSPEQAR